MPRRRKSEMEPSVSQMATPASAAPAERPRSAPVKTAAAKARTRRKIAVKPLAAPRAPKITHEEIALLAYSYWEARQSTHGSAEDDWFRAERELRTRIARSG